MFIRDLKRDVLHRFNAMKVVIFYIKRVVFFIQTLLTQVYNYKIYPWHI